jgi:hypothetical protein
VSNVFSNYAICFGQYESSVPNKIVAFFADIFNDGNDDNERAYNSDVE